MNANTLLIVLAVGAGWWWWSEQQKKKKKAPATPAKVPEDDQTLRDLRASELK